MRPEGLRYNQSSMRLAAEDEATQPDTADVHADFHALVSGCGVYKLHRSQIVLTGSDRVRWLHGVVTNNVRDLAQGQGVYAFLLNPQGKIQADLYAFNRGESLVVKTELAQVETVLQIFDRYIIMDDVEVENLTGKFAVLGVAGPPPGGALDSLVLDGRLLQPFGVADAAGTGTNSPPVRADNRPVHRYHLS